MMTRKSLMFSPMLALVACTMQPTRHSASHAAATWITYACDRGSTVRAAYPDSDTAIIEIEGKVHRLHIAIAASGARYTGDGWQWWTRGMHDGMLAPLAAGETLASAASVDCHAP